MLLEADMHEKFVAIILYDNSTNLLKIGMTTQCGELILSRSVEESCQAFGIGEFEEDGNFFALLATPEGPLLCYKGFQYRPEFNKTTIELKDEGELSHFRVLHEGEVFFHMTYVEKIGIGLHPYANCREDIDFYYWLSNSKVLSEPSMYKHYTRQIVYMG